LLNLRDAVITEWYNVPVKFSLIYARAWHDMTNGLWHIVDFSQVEMGKLPTFQFFVVDFTGMSV